MRAAVRSKYGAPGVLSIKEIDPPVPRGNQVLVKVHATTVNRTDCGVLFGKPFVMRLFTGLIKPASCTTGSDFAGEIVSIGEHVTNFKVGDRVMGFLGVFGCGSHAEYLLIPETKAMITIPCDLSYKKAVACIEGAYYASVSINILKPRKGQNALVNGATGAFGSSIVQMLKFYGTNITAVCHGNNSELVRILGADRVIDYTMEDFTKEKEKYDYVFDAVGKSSFGKCKPLLKDHGVFIPTDGMENLLLAMFTPMMGGKKVLFPQPRDIRSGLRYVSRLVESRVFRPVIDREYSMDEIVEAYEYVASGQKIGNVILNVLP
jgi:NADPH:quinone reductase-like Zn-dependent oxidoreductase